jgi:hypothetical protein
MLLGSFSQTLTLNQKVLFRRALSQFLPIEDLMKWKIVETQGEYDYAKYDPKVLERVKNGELPNLGGAPKSVHEDGAESVHEFLQDFSNPYQKKVRKSFFVSLFFFGNLGQKIPMPI